MATKDDRDSRTQRLITDCNQFLVGSMMLHTADDSNGIWYARVMGQEVLQRVGLKKHASSFLSSSSATEVVPAAAAAGQYSPIVPMATNRLFITIIINFITANNNCFFIDWVYWVAR